MHISATVIQEPDDITLCEADQTHFTCEVNATNSNINHTDMQWYRFIYSTSTTERIVNSIENPDILSGTYMSDNNYSIASVLHITNARQSYSGYYWVGIPSFNVCNVSLTVVASMLIEFII